MRAFSPRQFNCDVLRLHVVLRDKLRGNTERLISREIERALPERDRPPQGSRLSCRSSQNTAPHLLFRYGFPKVACLVPSLKQMQSHRFDPVQIKMIVMRFHTQVNTTHPFRCVIYFKLASFLASKSRRASLKNSLKESHAQFNCGAVMEKPSVVSQWFFGGP